MLIFLFLTGVSVFLNVFFPRANVKGYWTSRQLLHYSYYKSYFSKK